MSPATLAVTLAVALAAIAIVLNHCYARLALVELALNEGLPPGHQPEPLDAERSRAQVSAKEIAAALDPGVHLFLSRNCHACQRLVAELDEVPPAIEAPVSVHYLDRPRPIAHTAARKLGGALLPQQADTIAAVGADPLPYTIAIGDHGLVSRSVTPSRALLVQTARDAGYLASETASSAT